MGEFLDNFYFICGGIVSANASINIRIFNVYNSGKILVFNTRILICTSTPRRRLKKYTKTKLN